MATIDFSLPEIGSIQAGIDEIKKDRASGAAKQTLRAAKLLIRCAQDAPQLVSAVARAVMAAQPAMGSIYNLADRSLCCSDVSASCLAFLDSMEQNTVRVAERTAALIQEGTSVMTHSFSSTILAAFREALRRGKQFSVICPESRPVCEGLAMAASLGMAGIPSSLITDSAMYQLLPEVDLVLVGADAVCRRGVINKTGTSLLALAARDLRVPIYALCSSDKLLPRSYDPPPEEPKDPRELLERDMPNVTVRNYYFDVTPLGYLSGIVTEEGILSPAEMRARLLETASPTEQEPGGPMRLPDGSVIVSRQTESAHASPV